MAAQRGAPNLAGLRSSASACWAGGAHPHDQPSGRPVREPADFSPGPARSPGTSSFPPVRAGAFHLILQVSQYRELILGRQGRRFDQQLTRVRSPKTILLLDIPEVKRAERMAHVQHESHVAI